MMQGPHARMLVFGRPAGARADSRRMDQGCRAKARAEAEVFAGGDVDSRGNAEVSSIYTRPGLTSTMFLRREGLLSPLGVVALSNRVSAGIGVVARNRGVRSRYGRGRAVEAVVFDLDGVLLDSEAAWDDARREVAATHGGGWRPESTRVMQGMSSREWSRYLYEELGTRLDPAHISSRVVDAMERRYHACLPLLPGALEAVERLAAAWRLGLASSSNRELIDLALAMSGMAPFFTATVSSEEVPRGKPAPDVYLEATKRLGVRPSAAVAIEDSSNGLLAAHTAGLGVIAVPNPRWPPSAEGLGVADVVVATLDDVSPRLIREAWGPTSRA
jgi:HAD superfamily hydrolase (TIGR01509 family)